MSHEASPRSPLLDRLHAHGHAPVVSPQRKVEGRLDVDVPGKDGWWAALRRVLVPTLVLLLVMTAVVHEAGAHPGFIYAEF